MAHILRISAEIVGGIIIFAVLATIIIGCKIEHDYQAGKNDFE